jgi:hypothetical protein
VSPPAKHRPSPADQPSRHTPGDDTDTPDAGPGSAPPTPRRPVGHGGQTTAPDGVSV